MLIVMGLQMMIKAPITAAWAICKIAGKQWEWTLSTGIAVLVLFAVVGICVFVALPKFKKMQRLTDDLNRITRENLSGLKVVRAYNAEEYQKGKFEGANEALTGTNLFAQHTMAFMMPSIQMIMSGLSLSIYWIGAVLIGNAAMASKLILFSDMMVFSQYAIQVVMSFMMLVAIFIMLPRASVAANRICEVLETKTTILDGEGIEGKKGKDGEVEFRHVSFRYPDADKIIVLDEGRIAGIGRHKDLVKNCEVYQQIALSQLSKEELA